MTANLKDVREALAVFCAPGGDADMQAFHDLEDDVVVWENSGKAVTAGDVRNGRRLLAQLDGVPVSEMHCRRRAASVLSQMETPAPQSGGSPVGDDTPQHLWSPERQRAEAARQAATSPQPLDGVKMVHIVICCNADGTEVRHVFSSADRAQAYADSDQRTHILYDYLLDCPERHEGCAQ